MERIDINTILKIHLRETIIVRNLIGGCCVHLFAVNGNKVFVIIC